MAALPEEPDFDSPGLDGYAMDALNDQIAVRNGGSTFGFVL